MAKNPLDGPVNASAVGSSGGPMRPGETRTISIPNDKGITITRTNRPYVHDLCDARNAANKREDLEWYVSPNGELRLRYTATFEAENTRRIAERYEVEREEWKRAHRQMISFEQKSAA